jgi:hypothetical protein
MAEDESIFLADIDEKTLADLDLNLAIAAGQPNSPRAQRPPVEAYAAPALPTGASHRPTDFSSRPANSVAMTDVPRDEASGTMNFIDELAQEVAARKLGGAQQPLDAQHKAHQLHEALSRIFAFFNQLSRHANQLEPEISRAYRLDAQTAYSGLRWRGAFADFRKQDLSENARLSHASFRVRLVAPQSVTLIRRWDQLESLKRDLHVLDLRIINDAVFAEKPEQEFVEVQLASDFPVQISFKGNYSAHRVDLLCRNLEGFSISAFTLEIEQVTQLLLEDLGRFLLSRSNTLPGALRRVNHVPPAAKKP